MFGKAGCYGDYSDLETLTNIRYALSSKLDVQISNAEAHNFWRWRSEKYDAGFLVCEGPEAIVEWFETYIIEWWNGDDVDDEFVAPYEMKKENK
jgi:hypothetical protein